jgi:hypothetical protein
MGLGEDDNISFGTSVDEYINDVWKYSPRFFLFNGMEMSGDDVTQSPIWVRPQSLNEDAYAATHVVGHTQQRQIGIEPTKFIKAGESKEVLVIDETDVAVCRIENKTLTSATQVKPNR